MRTTRQLELPSYSDHTTFRRSVMVEANPTRRHPRFKDLAGQQFGKWTAITVACTKHKTVYWDCRCECGKISAVNGTKLRTGKSKCCSSCQTTIHGKSHTPEYSAWKNMKKRCQDISHKEYDRYGGRGITVCDEWESLEAFLSDVGPRPSPKHSLERIDNCGNYEPSNCRWATAAEQQRNTRRTRLITYRGKTQCIADWSIELGIKRKTIQGRLRRGWTVERALTEPKSSEQPNP